MTGNVNGYKLKTAANQQKLWIDQTRLYQLGTQQLSYSSHDRNCSSKFRISDITVESNNMLRAHVFFGMPSIFVMRLAEVFFL